MTNTMKIKTVSGEEKKVREITSLSEGNFTYEKYVLWADIKPILEEYQSAIENESVGCSDYGLMGDAMLEDKD